MTIVVCTDFSTASAAAEREAARRFPDATLVLFHCVDAVLRDRIIDVMHADGVRAKEEMTLHADRRLTEVVDRLTAQKRRAVPELVDGDPVELALACAARHRAELIVIGCRVGVESGRMRTLLARRSPVALLVIPSRE
jgi:hypothetical protein